MEDIDVLISNNLVYGIIGPNGSGKTTLLKHLYKDLTSSNHIFVNGIPIESISFINYAKICSVVTQTHDLIERSLSVEDIVMMGRYPHNNRFEPYNDFDIAIVDNALKKVGLINHRKQSFTTLSGGERQRTLLAKAIAQDTELLIMDEPTNHLDLKHQVELIKFLNKKNGTTILSCHDLNFASQICDRLLLLKEGAVICEGTPENVLTNQNLCKAYDLEFDVHRSGTTINVIPIYK